MPRNALADFLASPQSEGWRDLPFFRDRAAADVVDGVARRGKDGATILPEPANIFNALRLTSPAATRVVILGQDPYPTPGHANGLAFSYVGDGSLPASLRNIFKDLAADLGLPLRTRGDLSDWARQGVLLLNTALTVEAGAAGAHMKLGWQQLTRQAVKVVSDRAAHCVFILWGDKARAYADLIDPAKHLVVASVHPSPLSARNGFFGSRPFSRTNEWLVSRGLEPIDWLGVQQMRD
jgi:uracil-DNA glycosylase